MAWMISVFSRCFRAIHKKEKEEFFLEIVKALNHLYFKQDKTIQEMYGPSSERFNALCGSTQLSLFDFDKNGELKDEIQKAIEMADELRNQKEPLEDQQKEVAYKRKTKNRSRRELIDKLPVTEINLYPEGEEFTQKYENCFETIPTIHEEVIYESAKMYVKRTICHNYIYTDEHGESHSYKAKTSENKLIENSYVSPSLISHIAYNKCILDTPLYRQAKDLAYRGLTLSRQTISNWMILVSEL
ncbi:Transposase, IS66, partial [gut metagenome]